MKLVVGLGNPGGDYARNRHNVGFMAADRIAAAHGFGPWRDRFRAKVAEGRLGTERVLLLKPQTFMNLSGESVGEAARFLKVGPADIVVLHDELDLAPGQVRMKAGGGHAGHNGLRSLHQHLGEGYRRLRIGIGHPGHRDRVSAWVLGDFAKADQDWLEPLLDAIAEGAPALAAGDGAAFGAVLARRLGPPPAPKPPKPPKPRPQGTAVAGGNTGLPATGGPAQVPRGADPAAAKPAAREVPPADRPGAEAAKRRDAAARAEAAIARAPDGPLAKLLRRFRDGGGT